MHAQSETEHDARAAQELRNVPIALLPGLCGELVQIESVTGGVEKLHRHSALFRALVELVQFLQDFARFRSEELAEVLPRCQRQARFGLVDQLEVDLDHLQIQRAQLHFVGELGVLGFWS